MDSKMNALGSLTSVLLALLWSQACSAQPRTPNFYSIDSAEGPGKAGQPFSRTDVKGYNASLLLASAGLPSPRAVSLGLSAPRPGEAIYPDKTLSKRNTTAMLTYFGQLVSHDINHRGPALSSPAADNLPMDIPANDVWYRPGNGTVRKITLRRDHATMVAGQRTAFNNATAWVDMSFLYTTSKRLIAKMRTMKDGMLLMAEDGQNLPLARNVLSDADIADDSEWALGLKQYSNLRLMGDIRGNQNPGALALRTLFMRNHNRLAKQLKETTCAACTDEQLFQQARRWNIANFQAITFYEYLPQLGIRLDAYNNSYDKSINPGVDNFFSTVSYRYGHSEVVDTFWRLGDDGTEIEQGHLLLAESYYHPDASLSAGIEPILRGMSVQLQGDVEPHFAPSVQQHLLGPATFNGTDLVATNIFRGRDHGLPMYNAIRQEFGMAPKASWDAVTSSVSLQDILGKTYPGGPSTCDAYVCGLAEDKVNNSHFGELFLESMKRQYLRTRNGDPLYFENLGPEGPGFIDTEVRQLKSQGLRWLIMMNSGPAHSITKLPMNIWNTGGLSSLTLGGTGGMNRNDPPNKRTLAQGQYIMEWTVLGDEIEIKLDVATTGWIGFGIAEDEYSGMLRADMVIVSRTTTDGPWMVDDYYSVGKGEVPSKDTDRLTSSQVSMVGNVDFKNGRTTVTFRRPLQGKDDGDRTIMLDRPQPIIYAWNPDTPIFGKPHLSSTRGIAMLDWTRPNAVEKALQASSTRSRHAFMMALSFVLLLPLGAMLARALRYNFIQNRPIKAGMFYTHVAIQLTGVGVATGGLVIILSLAKTENKKYKDVLFNHGVLGVAVMSLVYVQVVLGLIRPAGSKDGNLSVLRRMWDVVHAVFGRLVLLLSLINVFIGILLYRRFVSDASLKVWVALCGSSVVIIAWLQQVLDRMETLYVAKRMASTSKSAIPTAYDNRTPPQHGAFASMSSAVTGGTISLKDPGALPDQAPVTTVASKPWGGRKR